jgi:hypothetical protein
MDPFIEGQGWKDFRTRLLVHIGETLMPYVRPRYVVEVQERVYFARQPERWEKFIEPDVLVAEPDRERLASGGGVATVTAVATPTVVLPLPVPEEVRERYLRVRDRTSGNVVTVIEVLSPSNKEAGSDGRAKYLRKREAVLVRDVHLVELDLLRSGVRLPALEPLPPADYYAFVARASHRPNAEVYSWTLRQALPVIPIPLADEDPDVSLDL